MEAISLTPSTHRVAAHAALMTDPHPPVGPTSLPKSAGGDGSAPASWSARRTVAVVVGSVLLLMSGGLIAPGGWTVVVMSVEATS